MKIRDASLKVETLTDLQGFATLQGEWEELYRESPLATPFQSWAWLYSWWEFYGEGYELRLVTVRDGAGLLVGVLPLMLERKLGFGRLLFVGIGGSGYLDILVRKGWEARVEGAASEALRRSKFWQVADLHQLRPEGAAWGLFRRWDGPRACLRQDDCLLIEVKPWDELVTSLPKSQRTPTRRTLRRIREDGIRCRLAEPTDAGNAARRLVALSREQWRERVRETHPEHWSRRYEAYLEAAAYRTTACAVGGISEFWRDGEVVVSSFLLFGRDFIGAYMAAASQETLRRYSFNTLYVWDMLNIASSREYIYLNLFQGEEPYKLRWKPRRVPNHRVILGRSVMSHWLPYAGYSALRSGARRYVNSEDPPWWVKDVVSNYRSLRSGIRWYAERVERSGTHQWVKTSIERLKGG